MPISQAYSIAFGENHPLPVGGIRRGRPPLGLGSAASVIMLDAAEPGPVHRPVAPCSSPVPGRLG